VLASRATISEPSSYSRGQPARAVAPDWYPDDQQFL